MRWFAAMIFVWSTLEGSLADVRGWDQTFINETLLGQGLLFQIMRENLDAIKCVDGHKIYLKADRLLPSEEGMLLVASDSSFILLPKLYSDHFGCYIMSSMLCTSCGSDLPDEVKSCIRVRNKK